jgi:hypothetical protein
MNCQPKIKLAMAWRSAPWLDITDRVKSLGDAAMLCMLASLNAGEPGRASASTWSVARASARNLESEATTMYRRVSRDFFARSSTEKYLDHALALHRLVRHDTGVHFHQGIADGPATDDHVVYGETKRSRKLIGSLVSIMYEALSDDCDCKAPHSIITPD